MEELYLGGVVPKYHYNPTPPKVHHPTNFQTHKSKKISPLKFPKGVPLSISEKLALFTFQYNAV